MSFCAGLIYQENQYKKLLNNNNKMCEAAGIELHEDEILAGFYDFDGYYCIRTDIDWYTEKKTIKHEECHAIIHKDYEHFCGEK